MDEFTIGSLRFGDASLDQEVKMFIKTMLVVLGAILLSSPSHAGDKGLAYRQGDKYDRSEEKTDGGVIEFPVVTAPGSPMIVAVVKQLSKQGWPYETVIGEEQPIMQIGALTKTRTISFDHFVKSLNSSTFDSIWVRELVSTTSEAAPAKAVTPIVGQWKLAGKRKLRVEMPPIPLKGYALVRLWNGSYGSHQLAFCFGEPPHLGDIVETSLFTAVLGREEAGSSLKSHVLVSLAVCGGKALKGKPDTDNRLFKSIEALCVRFLPESELAAMEK